MAMANRTIAAILLLGASALWAAPPRAKNAATPPAGTSTFGAISGKVTDSRGIPQMGALVMVLAADGRVVHRLYTNELGLFVQDHLIPGVYNLKVTLASFLPVIRDSVGVQ